MDFARLEIPISLLLCLTWLTDANQNSGRQLVRDFVASMCPFSNFCYTNATRSLEKGQSQDDLCCLPCSCEEDCWVTKSCCIDKADVVEKETNLNCKDTLVKRSIHHNFTYQGIGAIRRYYIIDFCPNTQKNSALDIKCKAEHPVSLEELVWVTGIENEMIYQNQYCAECHGVEKFIPWHIRSDCIELRVANFSSLYNLLSPLDYCSINVLTPSNILHMTNRYSCILPAYDKCNISGTWKNFDPDVLSACETFHSPVFYRLSTLWWFGNFYAYKNIFCLVCNELDPTDFREFCHGVFDIGRGPFQAFSALINYEKYIQLQEHAKIEDHNTLRCRVDEVFDIYLERCRQLLCPDWTTPVYGQCEQLATEINGFNIRVTYHFKIQETSASNVLHKNQTDKTKLGEKILAKFQIASGLRKSKCQHCSLELYGTQNTTGEMSFYTGFYFIGFLYTNTKCQLDTMVNVFRKFDTATWKVRITDSDYIVLLTKSISTKTAIRQISEHIFGLYQRGICYADEDFDSLSKQFLCPALSLNFSDISSLEDLEKKRHYLAFLKENQHSAGILRVCLEDYYSYMSSKLSVAICTRSSVYILFGMLSTSFIWRAS